jgi:hypothetical protein
MTPGQASTIIYLLWGVLGLLLIIVMELAASEYLANARAGRPPRGGHHD